MAFEEDVEPGLEDSFDAAHVDSVVPLDDAEARRIEFLCRTATPGPLVVEADGWSGGTVVATMPDGRQVVSITTPSQPGCKDEQEANLRLICRGRQLLLRMLNDRKQWSAERALLRNKLAALEDELREVKAR